MDVDPSDALQEVQASAVFGFWEAFVNSFVMIIATELGDRTFFLAAIMAMQHSRVIVFAGAIAALAVMTVLSSMIGVALPNLLPREYTQYAAIALFVYFGGRMLKDGLGMEAGVVSEELAEVEDELGKVKDDAKDVEQGGSVLTKTNLAVLTESFTLTFIAEWGDKSQIATIALAAARDPFGVTGGGIVGHAMCTGLAVVGGRFLASKMSERTVTIMGGTLFLVFAVHALFTLET